MQPTFQINIAEPCHEDWHKMSPVEQGRFCGSCQKNVIDFTTKSDEEIISFFNNYNGSSCGRFTNEQLNRPIQSIELKPASRFIKYAASLLLPAAFVSAKINAQTTTPVIGDTTTAAQIDLPEEIILGTFIKAPPVKEKLVRGQVVDAETNEPLSNVSVMIKGTNKGVFTDANGRFTLPITNGKEVIHYSNVGYETAEIKISKLANRNEVIFKMKMAPRLMGEVIVVGYASRTTCTSVMGTGTIVRTSYSSVWDKMKDTILPSKVNVYPNPVAASGTVQLTFPNVKPGTYQIRVLNNNGQLFYSFQKQISGKNETEQIHLSNLMAAGMYLLQVTDEKNTVVQNSKLIIQ